MSDSDIRRQRVLSQLDEDIQFFRKTAKAMRTLYRFAQVCSLGCASAVPVLIAADIGGNFAQATVAAVAAFATASIEVFNLKDEWISHVFARQMLIDERLAFELRAGPYYATDDLEEALANILNRRKIIHDTSLSNWKEMHRQDDRSGQRRGQPSQRT